MKHKKIRMIIALMAAAALVSFALVATGCQEGAGDGQAEPASEQAADEGAADQAEAATYSFKTCVLERYGDDAGALAGTPRFSYLQLSSSQDNAMIDELNASMKESAEAAFALRASDEIYNNPTEEQLEQEFYGSYNFGISYLDGSTICIVHDEYATLPQSAHGTPATTALVYDLGAQTSSTAASAVGLGDDELGALTWAALDRYLAVNGDIFGSAAEAFPDAADGVVPDEALAYCLTDDGVVAVFQPYAIGSYAMGMPALLVCGPDGEPAESDEAIEIEMLPGDGEEDVA